MGEGERRDVVAELIGRLDGPVAPDPAFAAELRRRLAAEWERGEMPPREDEPVVMNPLGARIGAETSPPRLPSRAGGRVGRRWTRALEMVAAALLVLAIGGGLVLSWGPRPERDGRRPEAPAAIGGATAMLLGNAARTGEVAGPGPAGKPERLWRVPLGDGQNVKGGPPIVADGVAFVSGGVFDRAAGTTDGVLLAIDAATGKERWRVVNHDAGGRSSAISLPAVADGLVFAGTAVYPEYADSPQSRPSSPVAEPQSSGSLVAFDARSGVERWRALIGASSSSSPAVVDDVVYLGSEDGRVAAFDARSGAQRWRSSAPAGGRVDEQAGWYGDLAVAGGMVYVAGGDGVVRALDAATGKDRWRHEIGGSQLTTPVVAGGAVYVGAMAVGDAVKDGGHRSRLSVLDAATGAERWTFVPDRLVHSPPLVGGDTVYVGDDDGSQADLVALDAASGRERWRVGAGTTLSGDPVLADGVLYVTAYDRGLLNAGFSFLGAGTTLSAFDAGSGSRLWRTGIEGETAGPLAVSGGVVYVVDPLGEDAHDAGALAAYGAG